MPSSNWDIERSSTGTSEIRRDQLDNRHVIVNYNKLNERFINESFVNIYSLCFNSWVNKIKSKMKRKLPEPHAFFIT